jgi:hypothetical protein
MFCRLRVGAMALLALAGGAALARGQSQDVAGPAQAAKTERAAPPEQAGSRADAPLPEKPAQSKGPLKVVCWYYKRDPVQTYQHKVYDVSKGQYTQAVDDWLKLVKKRYPDYVAYVRTLDLNPQSSETEQQQVAHLIGRELTVIAAHYYGIDPHGLQFPNQPGSAGRSLGVGPSPFFSGTPSSPGIRPLPSMYAPLGAAEFPAGNRSTYANPVSSPYVRTRPP